MTLVKDFGHDQARLGFERILRLWWRLFEFSADEHGRETECH